MDSVAGSAAAFDASMSMGVGADAAKVAKRARTQAAMSVRAAIAAGEPAGTNGPAGGASTAPAHATDGRLCKLCQSPDNSKDPIDGGSLAWWYAPKNGKTQGCHCFYCGKAWHTKFRHDARTKSLSALLHEAGKDTSIHESFMATRKLIIDKCLQNGGRDIRVTSKEFPIATVVSKERTVNSIEDSDDWVELEYYRTQYFGGMGDPMTNGRGHRVVKLQGQMGVVVPGPPVKKLKRAQQGIVDVVRVEDDGQLELSESHAGDVAAAIAAGFSVDFRGGQSAGVGSSPPPAAAAHSQATAPMAPACAPAPAPASSPGQSVGCAGFGGHRLGFEVVVPQLPGSAAAGHQEESASARVACKAKARCTPRPASAVSPSAASSALDASKSGPGRKRRNLVAEAQRAAGEFAAAGPDDKGYFGTSSKTTLQWMMRLQKDFKERIPTITAEQEPCSQWATSSFYSQHYFGFLIAPCRSRRGLPPAEWAKLGPLRMTRGSARRSPEPCAMAKALPLAFLR